MDLSMLKTQIMTMFMMKQNTASNPSNPSNPKTDDSGFSVVSTMIYTMVFMNLLEMVFRGLPILLTTCSEWLKTYLQKKTSNLSISSMVSSNKDSNMSSISLMRTFSTENKNSDENTNTERVDAVINFLCNIDNSKHIKLHKRYLLNTKDDIVINPNLKAHVDQISYNDKGDLAMVEIRIFSETMTITEIRKWMEEIYQNHCIEKLNNLGNRRFYFNEIPIEPMRDFPSNSIPSNQFNSIPSEETSFNEKTKQVNYRWETAPSNLTFTMNEFRTSKSLSNIFGDHVSELKDRIDLFLNHPEWYSQRGIPYSLGILLHGIPGAGKTSTIKGIAKDMNRHIINISLRPFTTQKQLLNLFFNETISILNNEGAKQTLNIPLNQRIYVIEDIDCLSEVVFDRRNQPKHLQTDNGKGITLSFILNLLDGVLETPGRILIITTNYPDKLDSALIRPGRIDVNISFSFANSKMIMEMINNFYSINISINDIPDEVDNLTPAEVIECLCNNYKDYLKAIQQLRTKSNQKNKEKTTEIEEMMKPDLPLFEIVESKESETPVNTIDNTHHDTHHDTHQDTHQETNIKMKINKYPLKQPLKEDDYEAHLEFYKQRLFDPEFSDATSKTHSLQKVMLYSGLSKKTHTNSDFLKEQSQKILNDSPMFRNDNLSYSDDSSYAPII